MIKALLKTGEESLLPRWIVPQLATLVDLPPQGEKWLHEIKFDGYRIIARIDDGKVHLFSRNKKDWSERYSEILPALAKLPLSQAVLDGEMVVITSKGEISFGALQRYLQGRYLQGSDRSQTLTYFLFDVMYLDGYDLRNLKLIDRKKILKAVLAKNRVKSLRYTDHLQGEGRQILKLICEQKIEGLVSKRVDSVYTSERTHNWLKSKCLGREDFIVGGFTLIRNLSNQIGALLVGKEVGKELRYCGKVGTGFSAKERKDLFIKLSRDKTGSSPFKEKGKGKGVMWVRPRMRVELAFTEETEDGLLRHPTFLGVREDG